MAKKILIVDDEAQIISMVSLRLEAAGYEVITACEGQEGLEKAKSESPDLIILDVMMPKMDGYKVCGLLKSDMRFNKIPIILFTAKAQAEDKQMSDDVGADAYINKPFIAEELMAKIKGLVGE